MLFRLSALNSRNT